ncbi:DNA-binding transcriptional regulator, CsgD family [Aquimarina spongiae]|uniref:DNA-binding transcriptional regulator, CsgD family n=1 Tax=Aquimarina spongiae TaxID=570521 RepID=A0A1M6BI66_9FLAO|nr:DNA-binding transcriptional regulator, CsgD family [Aquimarina spongiae]
MTLISSMVVAQKSTKTSSQKEIDSLVNLVDLYNGNTESLYKLMNRSKAINYDEGVGKVHLKLSAYFRKHNKMDSAFYHVNKTMLICKNNDFKPGLNYSYLSLGNIYGSLRNYRKSLEYYLKAYDFYKNQKDSIRYKNVQQVLVVNIASTYSVLGDYQLAHSYYTNHLNNSLFNKQSRYGAQLYQNMALNFKRQKKYELAIQWLNEGLAICLENEFVTVKNDILVDLCNIYLILNKDIEAQQTYDRIDRDHDWDKNYYLGAINLANNNLDEAENLLLESLKKENVVDRRMNSYLKLSEIYEQKEEWKKAFLNKNYYHELKDSIIKENNKNVIQNNELGFKLIEEEMLNKQLETENELLQSKNRVQFYLLFGGGILVLVGLLCFFLLIKYVRSNRKLKELKKVEKRLLEDKIELRENELNMTLTAISNRQKILLDIKNEIYKIDVGDKKIKGLKVMLKNLLLSGNNLSAISDRVESRYPGIAANLKNKHPDLSDTEIKYCLFTKLNLSTKETANILGVTADTVKTSRSRIKKKMNVPNTMGLKLYLDQITQNPN